MSDYLQALPDEVVVATILLRLLAKSILQCRCVCKSWYSLFTTTNFISKHLLRTKTLIPENPQILLHQKDFKEEIGNCLLLFDNQDYIHSMSFDLPHPPNPYIQIVGSVNGVICFSISQDRDDHIVILILCNPSISHFQSIPLPHSEVIDWTVKGFGFDERTLDFNILLLSPGKIGFIYSLNSNAWRSITCVPENWVLMSSSAVFVNGRFHWLACDIFHGRVIMVFDVMNETFGYISLPASLASTPYNVFGIMEFGESSIALMVPEGYVWIMKEYGSVKSWIKLTILSQMFLGFKNKDEALIFSGCLGIGSQKINYNKLELEEGGRGSESDGSG